MVYLISDNDDLFKEMLFHKISVEDALKELSLWKCAQMDSETDGCNPHINKLLCVQLGNDARDVRIVIDCLTTDIKLFKGVLEGLPLIAHNAKFDLQFLYSQGIVPRKIYDTMIVEQLLYLGYPTGQVRYNLAATAHRYLDVHLDKTIRAEISSRGLDIDVIKYAAMDVCYLEQIYHKQSERCRSQRCSKAALLECRAVPFIAYMEWCGIKLDESAWKAKMQKDQENLEKALKELNEFTVNHPALQEFVYVNKQGSLFDGFDDTPKVSLNWSSSQQVVKVAKLLGFDTTVQDKKTGQDKDSVLEKSLQIQKGICDEFLEKYFAYQEYSKVTSSFGQAFLDAINPVTGRLHTKFNQFGTKSGRLSCGGGADSDLAKYKNLPNDRCKYLNCQQLPHDAATRACFVAEEGNLWVSTDFSSEESILTADITQDEEFIKEFTERSGDTHAMFCFAVYEKECRERGCESVSDVKSKAKDLRTKIKPVEFAYLFGASPATIAKTACITVAEAEEMVRKMDSYFSGLTAFKKKASAAALNDGYVEICSDTGHKLWWWDHAEWVKRKSKFTSEFWENYRLYHKGTGDEVAKEVKMHFQAADKYSKLALNARTQGRGAIIFKDAGTQIFDWIVDNNQFGRVKICVGVHDEFNCEYPEDVTDFPDALSKCMENAAAKYCKTMPIKAVGEIGHCWIH